MTKILKKALIVLFITTLVINGIIPAFAEQKEYVFTDSNGETIYYYIDDEDNPYIIENGEKVFIALPLERYRITDENILSELNAEMNTRGAPTNYVTLTVPAGSQTSTTYSNSYNFANYTTHNTPIFKMSTSHSKIRFRTTNLVKPLLGSSKVSFVYRYYSTSNDAWYQVSYNNKTCTGATGFAILYVTDCRFSKYTLLIPTDVTSYTGNFWTTAS